MSSTAQPVLWLLSHLPSHTKAPERLHRVPWLYSGHFQGLFPEPWISTVSLLKCSAAPSPAGSPERQCGNKVDWLQHHLCRRKALPSPQLDLFHLLFLAEQWKSCCQTGKSLFSGAFRWFQWVFVSLQRSFLFSWEHPRDQTHLPSGTGLLGISETKVCSCAPT